MGRKCAVPECLSEEGREVDRGVTFHKIPLHSDIRPTWMALCHIPEGKCKVKVIHICSRHFLKADFCNFKGKKYLLKHGVLPSFFPWNKLKGKQPVDGSPSNIKKELLDHESDDQSDTLTDSCNEEVSLSVNELKNEMKEIPLDLSELKEMQASSNLFDDSEMNNTSDFTQNSSTIEQRGKSVQTSTGLLNFTINTKLEALDFNQTWLPARIIEIDYEEDEVLIHFEKCSSKYDEWISMSSSRLRSSQTSTKKSIVETFVVGENCWAIWNDHKKKATVTKVVDKDTYEVLFKDGFVKILKAHKLSKLTVKAASAAPLFDPVKGSKQDRRDQKRKINVSELFRKRPKIETAEEHGTSEAVEEPELWFPKFENGQPVGTDSSVETADGPKKSVLVVDPNLPKGWKKHLVQKSHGAAAGKWDAFIVSPDGQTLRNKIELKSYLEENARLKCSEKLFNFKAVKRYARGITRRATCSSDSSPVVPSTPTVESIPETERFKSLKIPFTDGVYMCPIEGCGKSFRRVNLAQMHVKHYHPEFTKFLDCTPNVADLAYARTVGESLDKSPDRLSKTPLRQIHKGATTPKCSTPRTLNNSPSIPPDSVTNQQSSGTQSTKGKDSEIIKLLNSKPPEDVLPKYPPGLPPSMYPDIKLKDLLNKSEGIPKRDDLNLKNMSATISRPTGIKTLLPVVRSTDIKKEPKNDYLEPIDQQDTLPKYSGNKPHFHKQLKRKRQVSEIVEAAKKEKAECSKDVLPAHDIPTEPSQNPDYIVEGGQVIKIVRMKREEIINCTCGIKEEDGLMIQCEICLCWQHAYCNNIERENQVPEKYICYICQNPARQRSSKKYFHDQDWLKTGTLPVANYHCRDNEILKKRFEKLKKVHDLSGGILELQDFMHSLSMKIKIAQSKNHPKLYLWSKPWEKPQLPEKQFEDEKPTLSKEDISLLELADNKNDQSVQVKNDSSLFSKDEELSALSKLDFNSLMDMSITAPQPEAAIESADCQLNLVEHIAHSQSLVEERLNNIVEQVDVLDPENVNIEEDYTRTCQTVQLILRDLSMLKELCHSSVL